MDIKITTVNLDVSVSLKAINAFKTGDFSQAMETLFTIVDSEPNNWQARLLVGVCQFRLGQTVSSQRTFEYIIERCPEPYVARKARQAMDCIKASQATKNVQPGVDLSGAFAFLDAEMRESMGLNDLGGRPRPKPWSFNR